MTKYRIFVEANIHPENNAYTANERFVIHIPEHITYDSKQKAAASKTRWDYSFGLENNDVVLLIRHITVVDDTYIEIRSMPEFYYDYDTFIKLGGWIEHVTRSENVVNVNRLNKTFSDLFPNLLNENITQIHIEPTNMKICECQEIKNIQIPTPVNHIIQHIIQNSYVPAGNDNCNRPLVDESFYKALSVFKPNDIKGKNCHITEDCVSVIDPNNEDSEEIMYDNRMQSVVTISEWEEHCYEYTVEQKKERKNALEKQGLLDAFYSLKKYLQSHNSIRQIDCDMSEDWQTPYKIIEKDLSYGYKLTGFQILENAVLWEITTYERPIKQNDCIRGMDSCYLMFKDGITVNVASKLDYIRMCERDSLSENDYEIYKDEYIDISNIPLIYTK